MPTLDLTPLQSAAFDHTRHSRRVVAARCAELEAQAAALEQRAASLRQEAADVAAADAEAARKLLAEIALEHGRTSIPDEATVEFVGTANHALRFTWPDAAP